MQLGILLMHWITDYVFIICQLFRFLLERFVCPQPRFDSFLVGGWNTVLSTGDLSLANPTLLC